MVARAGLLRATLELVRQPNFRPERGVLHIDLGDADLEMSLLALEGLLESLSREIGGIESVILR
jgi:hypothetical protein